MKRTVSQCDSTFIQTGLLEDPPQGTTEIQKEDDHSPNQEETNEYYNPYRKFRLPIDDSGSSDGDWLQGARPYRIER